MNGGLGKDFYRKGNSVKRFGPFAEPLDSESRKVVVLTPFPKISSDKCPQTIGYFKTRCLGDPCWIPVETWCWSIACLGPNLSSATSQNRPTGVGGILQ